MLMGEEDALATLLSLSRFMGDEVSAGRFELMALMRRRVGLLEMYVDELLLGDDELLLLAKFVINLRLFDVDKTI